MLQLSKRFPIFVPSFVNNNRLHRGELSSFDLYSLFLPLSPQFQRPRYLYCELQTFMNYDKNVEIGF